MILLGSLSVFDRQLRLSWWNQQKIERTSVFLIADNPLSYLAVIGLVAIGYGKIYIFSSSSVYRFKVLFDERTGLYPSVVAKFIYKYLGKFLKNYSLDIEPIHVNLASEQALNLLLSTIKVDDNDNKILVDLSMNYSVKYFVNRAVVRSRIPSYIFAPSDDRAELYIVDVAKNPKSYKYLGEAYAKSIKYSAKPMPIEYLFLLFSGLLLGEATLRIQDPPKEFFVPTSEIGYPFSDMPSLKPYIGKIRKVVMVGCGALGTFYAIQLALLQNMRLLAIKEIVFIDPDEIELVNFNRQVLFWGDTIGEPKAKVMAERYKQMVYDKVQTEYFVANFSEVKDKLKDADLIIEGVDNWEARKEIARFAIKNKIPLISSGVEVLGGHTTYYIPGRTYCPFHSMDLENKRDPPGREGCLVIEPSVIFTNIVMSSLGILNSLALSTPINGVTYYSLAGIYEKYRRFHIEKFVGSCGD